MNGLKNAIQKLGDNIVDLMELKVQTVTGDVKVVLGKKKLEDLEKLLSPGSTSEGETAEASAKLQLILDTTIKFDGDSINFIDKENVTPDLLELHKGAVEAGLMQRQGLVEMFKGLIK